MQRRDLIKTINKIAKSKGLTLEFTEGGKHAKVTCGSKTTTIPRHHEINEMTARSIIRWAEQLTGD